MNELRMRRARAARIATTATLRDADRTRMLIISSCQPLLHWLLAFRCATVKGWWREMGLRPISPFSWQARCKSWNKDQRP